jgi:hypothetical protein
MKTKKILIGFFVMVLAISFVLSVYAKDKKSSEKVKGKIITNLDENYVKVIADDYKVHKIYFHKKTKVEATVKAKVEDLSTSREGRNFPVGTVTFVMKDGKPMAEKISYNSRANWGIKKKKKKK